MSLYIGLTLMSSSTDKNLPGVDKTPGEGLSLTLKPDKVAEIRTPLSKSVPFESQSHGVAELWGQTPQDSKPISTP